MSTMRGKGHWGGAEGIERVHGLSNEAKLFTRKSLNYARVQVALSFCIHEAAVPA
jgi:hypothetical protein